MEESELFTVNIFQVSEPARTNLSPANRDHNSENESVPYKGFNIIKKLPNMISARVLNGKMVELEHSKLVGPQVKFKTVIDFDRIIDQNSSLGVVLIPQERYINKPDAEE